MPTELHKNMVLAAKEKLGAEAIVDTDLRRMFLKGELQSPVPDLIVGTQLAVECILIPSHQPYIRGKEMSFPTRLLKTNDMYDKLILVFPLPELSNLKEIWIYKPDKTITKLVPKE